MTLIIMKLSNKCNNNPYKESKVYQELTLDNNNMIINKIFLKKLKWISVIVWENQVKIIWINNMAKSDILQNR